MNRSELSVIIPVFNGAVFLAPLLQHVRAASVSSEIIAVDDGSTDETQMIAEKFEDDIIYLRQRNQGAAAARNNGLRHVTAPFVAFLDVDDEWAPRHPSAALEIMRTSQWEIIIGKTQCLTRASADAQFVEYAESFHTLNVGSAIFRREVFDRAGDFNESLRVGEDVDWFLRAREKGVRMAFIEQTTLHYRLHDRNLIAPNGSATGGLLNALRLSIHRRREFESALADIPRIG
jgi:glycosyltransferase involved in cell wall biosynthesis